jgi:DNA-binding cell septation regulator SpoVG
VTLTLPSGLIIHDVTVHTKNNAKWVSMPAREWVKTDGSKSWVPIIEFVDADARERFRDAAIAALEEIGVL